MPRENRPVSLTLQYAHFPPNRADFAVLSKRRTSFPFYGAADGGCLIGGHLATLGDSLHGHEQLALGALLRRVGAALVEPAAIDELELVVEAVVVRRAHGAVRARDLLG